jgi:ribonuclease-3
VGLLVGHALMEAHPEAPEGQLSRLRAGIVNARSLAEVARELGLGRLLRLGRGEDLTGGRDKDNLLADAYEALIGAVYLDLGLPAADAAVRLHLGDRISQREPGVADRDFKTTLQELVQARFQTTPVYRLVAERGPDHDKEFTVELEVGGEVLGVGVGRSKKQAERAAAQEALRRLKETAPPAEGSA